MTKFGAVGAVLAVASGLMLDAVGAGSAAQTAAVAGTGSASASGGVADSLVTGSGGSGSSFSIKVGNSDVAGNPSGSAGSGSAAGSAAMCVTNPTVIGCPK